MTMMISIQKVNENENQANHILAIVGFIIYLFITIDNKGNFLKMVVKQFTFERRSRDKV